MTLDKVLNSLMRKENKRQSLALSTGLSNFKYKLLNYIGCLIPTNTSSTNTTTPVILGMNVLQWSM